MPARRLHEIVVFALLVTAFATWQAWHAARPQPGHELRDEPSEVWVHGRDQARGDDDHLESSMVLDAALVLVDRSSTGELLLVGGSVELIPGEEYLLELSFRSTDEVQDSPSHGFSRFSSYRAPSARAGESVFAREHADEAFEVGPRQAPLWARLSISGTFFGDTPQGVHLVSMALDGERVRDGSGGTWDFRQRGFAGRDGSVMSAFAMGDWLLLLGYSKAAGPGRASNRLAAWRERAAQALELAPIERAELDAAVDSLAFDTSHKSGAELLTLVDPAIELAQVAVALADVELAQLAREALGNDPELVFARIAALEPWYWDQEWAEQMRDRRFLHGVASRQAAVVACGALSLSQARAADEDPRRRVWQADRGTPWRDQLLLRFDPLRLLALDPEPALCAAVVATELENGTSNELANHVRGALGADIGTTDAARAAWEELREHWIARGGWQVRVASWGPLAMGLWILSPWLAALLWTLLPARSCAAPRLSLAGVLLIVLLGPVRVGSLNPSYLLVPFWWIVGRRWLTSGRRSGPERLLILLLQGASLQAAGVGMGLLPEVALLQPLGEANLIFGLIFLGYVFASQPERWKLEAWLALLLIGTAGPLLAWSRPLAMGALILALAALVVFVLGSRSRASTA